MVVVEDGDDVVDVDGAVEVKVEVQFTFGPNVSFALLLQLLLPGLPATERLPPPFFAAAADCLAGLAWLLV